MKNYRFSLILCLALCLFASCREQGSAQLTIVCTSDVHGNLFPYDFLSGDSAQGSLARVSSYLKELRQEGREVIYLDGGDMLQGTPATYCYNTRAVAEQHVAADALGYLQCDAVVLGNNDIEPGGPTYQRYCDDLSCAVLGGNIYFKGTEMPFLPPPLGHLFNKCYCNHCALETKCLGHLGGQKNDLLGSLGTFTFSCSIHIFPTLFFDV